MVVLICNFNIQEAGAEGSCGPVSKQKQKQNQEVAFGEQTLAHEAEGCEPGFVLDLTHRPSLLNFSFQVC